MELSLKNLTGNKIPDYEIMGIPSLLQYMVAWIGRFFVQART